MRKNAWETLVLLCRGFYLVFRSSPFLTPLLIVFALLAALEPVAHLWIMKLLVDKLAKLTTAGNLAGNLWGFGLLLKAAEFESLLVIIGIQFGIWVGGRLLHGIQSVCSSRARLNFELYVQVKIMRKCTELDLAYFENAGNLDELERALRGSSMSAWNLIWMLFSMIGTMLTMTTYLAVLFTLHWLAPLIVAVTTAPQMLSSAHFARARWKTYTENSGESRLRYYLAWLMGDKHSVKEIKLFGLSEYLIGRYTYFCKKYYDVEIGVERKNQIINFFLGALSNVGTIIIWFYVIVRAALAAITAGDAFLFLSAAESSRHSLLSLFSSGGRLYEQILFLSELFSLLDRHPESVDAALRGMGGPGTPRWGVYKAPEKMKHGIELKNVTFSYPGSEVKVLDNVSMFFPAGKSVAIVGKNGAGKTTLVKLLCRLYDVTDGEILIDGRNIREYEIESLRRMFSVAFQDFLQYYLTLRENIGFGDVERVHDSAQVMWAAQKAGVSELAEKLPLKYETYLAKPYGLKEAVDLSGGEWQKVSLARTFMRESPVVILDEPTASLDAFAEADIYETFEGLTEGKLSVIISHRFSTVKVASLIMVLDNGKLVQSGSHDELMQSGGLYSEMYSKQADRYK